MTTTHRPAHDGPTKAPLTTPARLIHFGLTGAVPEWMSRTTSAARLIHFGTALLNDAVPAWMSSAIACACRAVTRGVVVVVAAAALTACAGLGHRVDRSLLDQVPNEELLLLFDAENAVYIARDEADLATRNLEDARKALKRANAYKELINERRKSGAAIDSAEVLKLLEEWNDARIEMRDREVVLRDEELGTSGVRLWAARARYERAKAKLVKDFNPVGGANIDLADFDEQVKDWEGKEQEVLKGLKEREDAMLSAREAYIALAVQLQQASKGAYGGPWADLLD